MLRVEIGPSWEAAEYAMSVGTITKRVELDTLVPAVSSVRMLFSNLDGTVQSLLDADSEREVRVKSTISPTRTIFQGRIDHTTIEY